MRAAPRAGQGGGRLDTTVRGLTGHRGPRTAHQQVYLAGAALERRDGPAHLPGAACQESLPGWQGLLGQRSVAGAPACLVCVSDVRRSRVHGRARCRAPQLLSGAVQLGLRARDERHARAAEHQLVRYRQTDPL